MLHRLIAMPLALMADTTSAVTVMHSFVTPLVRTMCAVASVAAVVFLVHGGVQYMTASGKPENLEHAKRTIKNALIGLLIVIAAATLTAILSHAYSGANTAGTASLPQLQAIPPDSSSNGLVGIIIKAITGVLNAIIQQIGKPFLSALSYFTTSTDLMAQNSSVFHMWLEMVGIADALFVLVVALLGFHVMSASAFGFEEVEFKHLLPRFGLIFLGMNTSIFAIDTVISISNAMIKAVYAAGGNVSIWNVLTEVVKQSGGQGLAALLIMVVFVLFSVILVVYYVLRLITLYIGAVLSPLVLLTWLVPGFRDFCETAIKTYLTTIFVLFVHVVILQLASSLFTGMAADSGNNVPDTLMAMVTGLATLIALLGVQQKMMQLSYVGGGARNARRLGGQFINGLSAVTGKGATLVTATASTPTKVNNAKRATAVRRMENSAIATGQPQTRSFTTNKGKTELTHTVKARPKMDKPKTGTTYEAPTASVTPITKNKDKGKKAA